MAASETIWPPVLGINLETKMNSAVLKSQMCPTRECLYARIFADTKHLPPHFNRLDINIKKATQKGISLLKLLRKT